MALSDTDLVMLAKAAPDRAAFDGLVRRHQAGLRAFLRKLGADAAQADDLAQETFIKALRSLQSYRGGASFRSWLYAIAWREFLQGARSERSRSRLSEAVAAESQGEATCSTGDFSLDLQRALASLDDIERAAVLLCDAVGLSHGEASVTLGAPLGSVKTYVARAREKLRTFLENETQLRNRPSLAAENGVRHAV